MDGQSQESNHGAHRPGHRRVMSQAVVQAPAPRCFSLDYFCCVLCVTRCGSGGGDLPGERCRCTVSVPAVCLPAELAEELYPLHDAESLPMAAQG